MHHFAFPAKAPPHEHGFSATSRCDRRAAMPSSPNSTSSSRMPPDDELPCMTTTPPHPSPIRPSQSCRGMSVVSPDPFQTRPADLTRTGKWIHSAEAKHKWRCCVVVTVSTSIFIREAPPAFLPRGRTGLQRGSDPFVWLGARDMHGTRDAGSGATR